MDLRKTILIVCEGESTEPEYFGEVRDYILQKFDGIGIKILPKPKSDKEEERQLREGAKRRQLRKIDEKLEAELISFEIEQQYKAQPTRYVRQAQLGLIDGSYDEAWAVFDKDGHPAQEAAFELSRRVIKSKVVNIAFSSVAFEHWILLHYEQNSHPFQKPKCRRGGEYFECGSLTHPDDCHGERCICGYLTVKGYNPEECDRKTFSFFHHFTRLHKAFANAVWLRKFNERANNNIPIYNLNPYTDIDKLIFKLININSEFVWVKKNGEGTPPYIEFNLTIQPNSIQFSLSNLTGKNLIVDHNSLYIIDEQGNTYSFGRRETVAHEAIYNEEFDLVMLDGHSPVYFYYSHEGHLNIISDC